MVWFSSQKILFFVAFLVIMLSSLQVMAFDQNKCISDCIVSAGPTLEEQLSQYGVKLVKIRRGGYYRPPPRRPTYNRSYSSNRNAYRRPPVSKIKPLKARPLRVPTARLAPKRIAKPIRRSLKPNSLKRSASRSSSTRIRRPAVRSIHKSFKKRAGLNSTKFSNRNLRKVTGKSLNKKLRVNSKKLLRSKYKKAGVSKRNWGLTRFGKAKKAGIRNATRFAKWSRNASRNTKRSYRRAAAHISRFASRSGKRMSGAGLGKTRPKKIKAEKPVRILVSGARSLVAKGNIGRIKVGNKYQRLRLAGASGRKPVLNLRANRKISAAEKALHKKIQKNKRNVANDNKKRSVNGKNAVRRIPSNAIDTLASIKRTGNAPPGYKGGRAFRNDGRGGGQKLPQKDASGNPINYKEYDVVPYQRGVNRGAERIVHGSNGKSYYTNDHYKTFSPME